MTTRKWGNEAIVADAEAINFNNNDKGLDIVTLANGSYVVAWIDQHGTDTIKAQKFDASGNRFGDVFEIGASIASSSKIDVALTALADGGFVAAFTNGANAGDSWFERYDSTGTAVQTSLWDTLLNASTEDDPAIASTGSGFLIAETDASGSSEIWVQKRDVNGNIVNLNGSMFLQANGDAAAGAQTGPSIAFDAANNQFAVSWIDNSAGKVMMRVFNADGTAVTASTVVATDGGATDFPAPIVSLATGGYVLTWHANSGNGTPDDSSYSVHAKVFDADGVEVSGDITVNSLFSSLQARPDIVALRNGGFVVTWDDMHNGDRNISGQVFDAFGERVGSQFTVNTHTAGTDFDSRITELADGRLVVVWSNQNDGLIRQQIIDPRDGLVDGTDSSDTLYGHAALGDEMNGFLGDDIFNGLAGGDQIYGGEGNDTANGGIGDDAIYGGEGDDDLRGGSGEDTLSGGDGADFLRGGAGADLFAGGAGIDTVSYNESATGVVAALDLSLKGKGVAAGDTFGGVENLEGSNANDVLVGNSKANALSGLIGDDKLIGQKGSDTLEGSFGADTLTGGKGNDHFVYTAVNAGGDKVTDFSSAAPGNNDLFQFNGTIFGGLAAGSLTAAEFQISNNADAQAATVRFIFEKDTGILSYDADGNGAGGAVIIATLQAGATMSLSDIEIL